MKLPTFFFSLAFLFSIALLLNAPNFSVTALSPNIVFILADDLGYGEISLYPGGNKRGRIATPEIDKLISQGIKFTSAYAGQTVCAPSRCSLMTGKHTGHSTIRGNHNDGQGHDLPMSASDITFPQLLKKANYTNAAFGKWGLGYNGTAGAPRNKGFDYYFGTLDQSECHNYYPTSMWENEEQIFYPNNANASRELCMSENNPCNYSHTLFTNKTLTWLDNEAVRSQPFFAYVAYTTPHAGGWQGYNEDGAPVPSEGSYSNKSWPDVEKGHAAMITHSLDADVGAILDKLDVLGLTNNTLVIFASDNGAHNEGGHNYKFFNSSGPLRGFKRSLYEGGIRVPIIARWPGMIQPRTTSDFAFAFWDFLPTFLDLAGLSLDVETDGVSILPTLLGKPQKEKSFLYWEFCTKKKWGHAVRVDKWKGVSLGSEEPLELYDLEEDVGETNNLADQHPQIVAKLELIAKDAHVDNPYFPVGDLKCKSSL